MGRSRCPPGMPGRRTPGPVAPPASRSPWSCRRRRPLQGRGVPSATAPGSSSMARTWETRSRRWSRIRDAEGLTFVHPFDDPAVIAGHGSVGLELIDDLPEVDVVVVGVGGGGLISGVAAAVKGRRPGTRVYGVEPEGSAAVSQSMAKGEVVTDPADERRRRSRRPVRGRVDARDVPTATSRTSSCSTTRRSWPGCASRWSGLKQVLEPAGAAALAAVLAGRIPYRAGSGSRSSCPAGTSRSAGWACCSTRPGCCPVRRRDART